VRALKNSYSDFINKALHAGLADRLALVFNDVSAFAAENAVGLVLFQNNAVALNVYLNGILFGKVESSSHFDGENDSSQFVELANDSGGFHFCYLLLSVRTRLRPAAYLLAIKLT